MLLVGGLQDDGTPVAASLRRHETGQRQDMRVASCRPTHGLFHTVSTRLDHLMNLSYPLKPFGLRDFGGQDWQA